MKLVAHTPGAEPWPIDELFTLEDAFREAAEQTSSDAGSDLLEEDTQECRDELAKVMMDQMTVDLRKVGDKYVAPDRVRYTLEED